MALTTCPDCGREVSDRAPSCPHCGAPIAGQRPQPSVVVAKEGCFLQTLNAGCTCLGVGILAVIVIGIIASING